MFARMAEWAPTKPITIFTLVGGKIDDFETEEERHKKWRPTLGLAKYFRPARIHLITIPKFAAVAQRIVEDMPRYSPETEVIVHLLPSDPAWDLEENFAAVDDVAAACGLDPEKEDILAHFTAGNYVWQTGLFAAVEAGIVPGKLVLTNNWGKVTVVDLRQARFDRLARRFERLLARNYASLKHGIATRNARYNALIAELETVLEVRPAPILLTGPTGAGKTALARRIFELLRDRGRVTGDFVAVNCATLDGDLANAQLFGHVRGAFTGAVGDAPGHLREAHGGVLFLDEIGDLPIETQKRLLCALEQKTFRAVGARSDSTSDFVLICGTNVDLPAAVREGRFREDLYNRINVWSFALPALRERREDIEPNLEHELERTSEFVGRRSYFTTEGRARFLAFATSEDAEWRGNFRELSTSVLRMATLAPLGRIGEHQVERETGRLRQNWAEARGAVDPAAVKEAAAPPSGTPRVDALLGARAAKFDHLELLQLEAVLAVCAECRSMAEAGRRLFNVSREERRNPNDSQRLGRLLKRFGLSREDVWR
jgi:transcriptional regulatory protein RtcR